MVCFLPFTMLVVVDTLLDAPGIPLFSDEKMLSVPFVWWNGLEKGSMIILPPNAPPPTPLSFINVSSIAFIRIRFSCWYQKQNIELTEKHFEWILTMKELIKDIIWSAKLVEQSINIQALIFDCRKKKRTYSKASKYWILGEKWELSSSTSWCSWSKWIWTICIIILLLSFLLLSFFPIINSAFLGYSRLHVKKISRIFRVNFPSCLRSDKIWYASLKREMSQ